MTDKTPPVREAEAEEYYADLEQKDLAPLWHLMTQTPEPTTSTLPHLWRWRDFYPSLLRAADVMRLADVQGGGEVERRVLMLVNPGLKHQHSATDTLVGSVQLILPGEVAPAHRHSTTAVRFMIQGDGAYTNVEGEKVSMDPGDLVLTPNWTWHDHGNESDEPIVWMDGLDRPLMQLLSAGFFEPYSGGQQPVSKPDEYSIRRYGATNLRPSWEPISAGPLASPQVIYKWQETAVALRRLADLGETSEYGEVGVSYTNPQTGGHVLATIGCAAYLLEPSAQTQAQRHTGSAVYHVISGRGQSIVNGKRLAWEKGDFFVVPSWAWHEHAGDDSEESFLFCMNDLPVFQALGLYREEAYEEHGGHQPVVKEPEIA